MWVTTNVVSACWRPFSSVAPLMFATVSSPSNWRKSWLRITAPPAVNVNVLNRARAPIAAASVEICSASAPSPMTLT